MTVDFATYDDFRQRSFALSHEERYWVKGASSRSASSRDTFLSHSSKDSDMLPGVVRLLEKHGASVYCDLDDERMPKPPDPNTAEIIKSQIKISKRLVFFVTPNSKDSKWVPWELGIADALLQHQNVVLLPTAATRGEQAWARQEYLGLYRHIVWGSIQGRGGPMWIVYNERDNSAQTLSEWLA